MRARGTTGLVAAAVTAVLLAGCGSQGGAADGGARPAADGTHTMSDGTAMKDSEMKKGSTGSRHAHRDEAEQVSAQGAVTHRTNGPSQPAGMICSQEIAQAVQRTFALRAEPPATDGWAGHTYTCTYRLPHSTLRLSVEDLDQQAAGLAHFMGVQRALADARPIKGLENLGFPAFQTGPSAGQVGFLKDSKTLLVDAGPVAGADLPADFSRTEAAYGVAAAVIACWKE